MDHEQEVGPAEVAFSAHADTCPLGCGINYERGRCAEGDRLGDALDAEKDAANGA